MEVPIQIVAACFVAILTLQAWQVRMLYRLASRIHDIETTLEFNGMKLPIHREI